jgi:hypothetical protein
MSTSTYTRSKNMGKQEKKSYWEARYPGGPAVAKRFAQTLDKQAYGPAVEDAEGNPIPGYEGVMWGGQFAQYLPKNVRDVYQPMALYAAQKAGFVPDGGKGVGANYRAARAAGKVPEGFPDVGVAEFRVALASIPTSGKDADGNAVARRGITVAQMIQLLDGIADIELGRKVNGQPTPAAATTMALIGKLARFADTPEVRAKAASESRGTTARAAYTAGDWDIASTFGGDDAE